MSQVEKNTQRTGGNSLQNDLYAVTGHVISMSFDNTGHLYGVVILPASGPPSMMEVDGYQLERQILDLSERQAAAFFFDRFCILDHILPVPA